MCKPYVIDESFSRSRLNRANHSQNDVSKLFFKLRVSQVLLIPRHITCALLFHQFVNDSITRGFHCLKFGIVKQSFDIHLQDFGNVVKRMQIRLDSIATPFADRAVRPTNLFCEPFASFLLLSEHHFQSV